uniref:Uncharacterized protein n=1 Tax=Micrurus carvalhoi TaxID=3147026 RepID=A0A2H6NF23_9SAUR
MSPHVKQIICPGSCFFSWITLLGTVGCLFILQFFYVTDLVENQKNGLCLQHHSHCGFCSLTNLQSPGLGRKPKITQIGIHSGREDPYFLISRKVYSFGNFYFFQKGM